MWESGVSVGCILMYAMWGAAFALIGVGWVIDEDHLGQFGLVLSASAASLTIMRDNQRTRRMLRRPGETVAPLRRQP